MLVHCRRDMQVLGNTGTVLLSDGTIRCLTIDPADFDVSITNPLETCVYYFAAVVVPAPG
jgi:hypothetical protein